MDSLYKIRAVWQNTSLVQQALLIAIVLTFIIAIALLTHWVRRPDMRVLYSNLDPVEAAKIAEKISGRDIDYELKNGGTTIYAPQQDIAQLRLDMAKEGLPQGGQKGYGIFDNEKIGISPFVQNVNLKRALQEELAKSIQMIAGVTYARVHLVSTEKSVFASHASETSASVVLRLRAGFKLSALNIAAITHLVAGSVEGLESESVTVIDSQGQLLASESDQTMAGGANTIADYRERVEQNYASKVENMLTAVLGPGRATVTVSAVIDMNNISIIRETYDPKGVPKTETIKKSSTKKGGGAAPAGGEAAAAGSEIKDNSSITDYVIGKTVEQKVILPGDITSLTVAAFVDLSSPDPNETEPIIVVTEVEEIIQKALGPKLKPENLKVVDIKFHRPTELLITEEEEAGGLDFVTIARHSSMGIMALCALLALKILGGAKKKASATATAGQLPGAEGAAGLLTAGTESSEPVMVRRQIANALRSNPEQVKQLFSSWVEQKE